MKSNRWVLIISIACVLVLAVLLFVLQYRASLICMLFPIVCGISVYRGCGKDKEKKKIDHKLNVAAFVSSIFLFIASIFFSAMMLR